MGKHFIKKTCLAGFFSLAAVGANATPVTFDFAATDFAGVNHPAPVESVNGSFTLDGSVLSDLDLSIAGHRYTLEEVDFLSDWVLGAKTDGASGINAGTTDFLLGGTLSVDAPQFWNFSYSVAGVDDIFSTYNGSVTVRQDVPEPAAMALFSMGILGIFAVRRRTPNFVR